MQINLDTFNDNKSTDERIEETVASGISFKGLDNIPKLQEAFKDILGIYELENGVFRLINEQCSYCNSKLKRKGIYDKEITLPGGAIILLKLYQYSCTNCKHVVGRKLGSWFEKGDRYSSNIKTDAVRIYLSHLSSYEKTKDEINKLYGVNITKKTIRSWLNSIGSRAEQALSKEEKFSGHFIYDEEYMKVFLGDVGRKDAKLKKVEVYLLLFIDAITKKPILMLSDSLDKTVLKNHWKRFVDWTLKKGIPFKTLTTDGKREYNTLVNELNREYCLKIKHSYCVFHFKKNLYEVSNKECFGVMQTKKELPLHVKNQIKELEYVVDMPTEIKFKEALKKIIKQKWTFTKSLQDQIKRIKKYEKNYALHKTYPFLRTSNLAEQWFRQTKPEKVKKGYKTKNGLLKVLQGLAVKISNANWKEKLNLKKDITDATHLLISGLITKHILRPA